MLVAPITDFVNETREVYLPAVGWTDFYTGEKVGSGRITVTTENIPFFICG